MKKITLLFLLLSAFGMQAQAPGWAWATTTGDQANGDYLKDITHDSQGNVYMTGMFNSQSVDFGDITLTNSDNGSNVYVVKYNSSGTALWAKSFGSGSIDDSWAIAVDDESNVYITGHVLSNSITFGDFTLTNTQSHYSMFVVKLDVDGNVVWAKQGNGTTFTVNADEIATDHEGNILVTGHYTSGTITFNDVTLTGTGNGNLFVVKYDTDGNVLWAIDETTGSVPNKAYGLDTDADGNIYLTGIYNAAGLYGLPHTNTGFNAFVSKYDSMGNFVWATAPIGTGTGNISGHDVHVTATGKVVVSGCFSTNTVQFGDVTLTNTTTNMIDDIFVAQYTSAGTLEWVKSAGGDKEERGYKVASDAMGNIYLHGYFASQNISFGGISLSKSDNYSTISYVTKYSDTGSELWAVKIDKTTTGSSPNGGLTVDGTGNIYVAGSAYDDVAFGTIEIEDGGIFLAKMGETTTGVDEFSKNGFKVYPNPVKDVLTINGLDNILSVEVYNTLGQKMIKVVNNNTIDMSSLQTGWYIVEVVSDRGTAAYKVIKN